MSGQTSYILNKNCSWTSCFLRTVKETHGSTKCINNNNNDRSGVHWGQTSRCIFTGCSGTMKKPQHALMKTLQHLRGSGITGLNCGGCFNMHQMTQNDGDHKRLSDTLNAALLAPLSSKHAGCWDWHRNVHPEVKQDVKVIDCNALD